jgi:internalin A
MKKIVSVFIAVAITIMATPVVLVESITITNAITIHLRDSNITDEILVEMVTNGEIPQNVTRLWLDNNLITDINVLSGLTDLQYLGLSFNQITDIPNLNSLENLQLLTLVRNNIVTIPPSHLSGLKKLTSLSLQENPFNVDDVEALQEVLPECEIKFTPRITNKILAKMVASGEIPQNVEQLDLRSNQISDLSPLSELVNLRILRLDSNQITDLTALSNLKKLEQLTLGRNQITDITPLSNLTNLGGAFGSLNLSGNQISDISPLANLTKLQWLSLDNNQITDLTPLALMPNLTFFTLQGNPVTQAQIDDLKENMVKFSTFVNRILGEQKITINEALEILKYLAGIESSIISEGNVAFYAARITGGDRPTIQDVLEVLKKLAGIPSLLH